MLSFSVIIPVHNAELSITACIESCLHQSGFEVEILCIDDASTDGSVGLIGSLMQNHREIRLIRHTENLGPCESRIDGMRLARKDYILFLDADDALEKDAFTTIAAHSSNGSIELLKFGYTETPSGRKVFSKKIENPSDRIRAYLSSSDRLSPEVWTKAYSKELVARVLQAIEPCRAYLAEDVYISVVFAHQCRSGAFIDKALVRYSTASGGTAIKNASESVLERCLSSYKHVIQALSRYFNKHAPEFSPLVKDFERSCIADFFHNRIGRGNTGKDENRTLISRLDDYFARDSLASYFTDIQLESENYGYWFNKKLSFAGKLKRSAQYMRTLFSGDFA